MVSYLSLSAFMPMRPDHMRVGVRYQAWCYGVRGWRQRYYRWSDRGVVNMTQIDPSLGQSESCLLRPHVHRTRIAARRSYGALIALCRAQCAVRRCLIIRKTSGSALYAFDCAPPRTQCGEGSGRSWRTSLEKFAKIISRYFILFSNIYNFIFYLCLSLRNIKWIFI